MVLQTDKQTGYPSKDKPWLKYYDVDADERALQIPEGKTIWDVFEERLHKYADYPIIEYFGRSISRAEFIKNVYTWAKAFRKVGVKEGDIVPYYGIMMPDVCAMLFALNMIGACPYFLKLSIGEDDLARETAESRIAVVFDKMWDKVGAEFSKDRFEKVIVLSITDAMCGIKGFLVSALSTLKRKSSIPRTEKYISTNRFKKNGRDYSGQLKADFVADRNAIITSSSGTTVGGAVKGVVATNESVLGQIYSAFYSDLPFAPETRTLNHFPPTAATSLNSLFFLPVFNGSTVVIDPRVSENDFYNQLIKTKPNVAINTGSMWETFFNRVSDEMKEGKLFDLSYSKGWLVGGEGTTVKKLKEWDAILQRCGGSYMYSAYGLSETFSGICVDRLDERCDFSKPIPGIGLPQAGLIMGVFDEKGEELSYNTRGELCVKTKAAMKEYYNKPELTVQVKTDGWIHTGDLAEIDEKGFVYIWGRINDAVSFPDGRKVYFFDVANKIKEFDYIRDVILLPMPGESDDINVVAHIVWNELVSGEEISNHLMELNKEVHDFAPEINLCAYAFYNKMLPYSPTTLKKDKNTMSKRLDGYVQVIDGKISNIRFRETTKGKYIVEKV